MTWKHVLLNLKSVKEHMSTSSANKYWCLCDECLETHGGVLLSRVPTVSSKTCRNHMSKTRDRGSTFFSCAKIHFLSYPGDGMEGTFPCLPKPGTIFAELKEGYLDFLAAASIHQQQTLSPPGASVPLDGVGGSYHQGAINADDAMDDARVGDDDNQPACVPAPDGVGALPTSATAGQPDIANDHVDVDSPPGFLEELWDIDVDGVSTEVLSRLPGRDGATCRCHFDKRSHKMSQGVNARDMLLLLLNLVLVKATSPG